MKTHQEVKMLLLRDRRFANEWRRSAPQRQVAMYLVDLRVKNSWSQLDLAEHLGLKQSEVSLIEAGERNLSLKTLQKIAEATSTRLIVQFAKV